MATARSNIAKGRAFQRKVRDMFMECFCLDSDHCRVPVGCETGADLKLSKQAQQIVGLGVEMKNQKSISIWEALKQAQANCPNGSDPALVFHRSKAGNKEIWITVPLDHYLDLRKKLLEP